MPGLDGTGPRGEGPRTGGGFGLCPPNAGPGSQYPYQRAAYGAGRGGFPRGGGRGRAWGGGRGYGYNRYPYPGAYGANPIQQMPSQQSYPQEYEKPYSNEEEINYLKDQIAYLKEELNYAQQRLKELGEKEKDSKK